MKTEKKNLYKSIKNKHIFPSIMGLIITYCFVIIVAIIIFQVVISFLADSKLESEYKSATYMAQIYESATEKENAIEMLKRNGREFLIQDNASSEKAYNISYPVTGNTTCNFKSSGYVESPGISDKILVYLDYEENTLEITGNSLDISINEAFKKIKERGVFAVLFSSDEDDKPEELSIPLYFWISKEFEDKSGSIVVKSAYDINRRDIAVLVLMVIILAFVAVVLFIALIVRIVKRVARQSKLLGAFFTDVVTQGHNWMWFTIKGEQHIQKKKNDKLNFAILNISVVKYNTYCVCHSVEEGEKVLQNINKMISKSINKYEACAHHGTSSFAVLVQYADEDLLMKKVKFILRHLESVEPSHKFAYHVGIALMPAKVNPNGTFVRRLNVDLEEVYNNACAASATLDSSDDSAIAFFDDKLVEEQKWIDIVNEKQQSALDNEEFLIYYQPKYNPSTDELRGAEALIRWQSPEYGFVTPGRIIPIFEKNGFITEIDHYMIKHVARDQKRWLDAGFKCVPVSVNVSRAHFIESDLAEQIRDAVDNEGAPRELIEIELTESAFFDDKKALISTIEKLKSYGFAVSMDDFGAGYSSLNSLKDMPLDVLKLDADFFRGESEGGRGEIVVSEAIKLAKALKMRTVAEGVEVKDQVDFLAKQGCDMIQGYYYAKPMAGSDYELRMGHVSDVPDSPVLMLDVAEEFIEMPGELMQEEPDETFDEPIQEETVETSDEPVQEEAVETSDESEQEESAETPDEAMQEEAVESSAESASEEFVKTSDEQVQEEAGGKPDELIQEEAEKTPKESVQR